MVYDCFIFFNELDVLDIRLNELDSVVDVFVLVEARYSHQGKPKPLFFEDNKERFKKFLHKIRHIIVEEFPDTDNTWVREPFQRNAISRGLTDCSPDDVIVLSDVDEIPKASVIKEYHTDMGLTCAVTDLYYYKINYRGTEKWYKLRIFPYSEIKGGDIQQFRGDKDYDYKTTIFNGGWHFSFLGNKQEIRYKIDNWAHSEFNNDKIKSDENIQASLETGRDLVGRDLVFNAVPIDESFPQFVRENLSRFEERGLIAISSETRKDIGNLILEQSRWVYEEVIQWNSYNVNDPDVRNKNVLDLGGNVGAFAFVCLSLGARNIVSFEPHPDNFSLLTSNFEECKNVFVEEKAVNGTGGRPLFMHGSGAWASVSDVPSNQPVVSISLQDALSHSVFDNDNDLVLKIDVEGAEYAILREARIQDIRRFKTIFAEFHDKTAQENMRDDLRDYVLSAGFSEIPMVHNAVAGDWYFDHNLNKMSFIPIPTEAYTTTLYKFVRTEGKPQVYDCFSFFNELDLLEIRLNELDPYVDYFVLSEATVTHSGNPKPLYFLDNKERFKKFAYKIIHIIVDDCPQTDDPWIREHFQRNALNRGLTKCKDSDIIIVSDLDEIPKGSAISQYDPKLEWMYFEQHEYDYYLNNSIGISKAEPGVYSRITTYGTLKKLETRCTDLRYRDCLPSNRIADGGWHFSWIGGAEQIVKKLEAWAHQELNIDSYKDASSIKKNIDASMDAFGRHKIRGIGLVNVDSTFPKFIVDNYDSFVQKKMISPIKRPSIDSKVAIVMPYFNDPTWMIRSVMAIIGQTFQNWTLFLIDDGSTEPNKAVTILGQKLNNRICVLEKPNGGPSSARNLALAHVRSDPSFTHVAYCDADDIWADDYLESQLSNMGDADFVYSKVIDKFDNWQPAYRFGIPDPDEYPGLHFMLKSPFIFISSVVHKVDCLSVGSFDSNLDSIEDWDMWVRIAKAGYKFKKNNNVTITYIVKTNSSMAGRRTDKITSIFRDKHADDLHLVSQ
jgi:beta-1,4-mannosyl-glycoprotein beta-1,4-N-acetylglucosaminyltransferase